MEANKTYVPFLPASAGKSRLDRDAASFLVLVVLVIFNGFLLLLKALNPFKICYNNPMFMLAGTVLLNFKFHFLSNSTV